MTDPVFCRTYAAARAAGICLVTALVAAGLLDFVTAKPARPVVWLEELPRAGAGEPAGRPDPAAPVGVRDLEADCQERADDLRRRLDGRLSVVVRTPWVLAGDLAADTLRHTYDTALLPAAEAMAREYFVTPPDQPITVLMFSDEAAYRRGVAHLFADRRVSRFGYYKPGRRIVAVHRAAGDGPLWHELTHALMAFDFPQAPAWLDEGLAALHEAARLADGPRGPVLRGIGNWRGPVLHRAVATGELPPLARLLSATDLRGRDEAAQFASARYFCLFLQEQGRLAECYRRLRAGRRVDPPGVPTLPALFPDRGGHELERRFRDWLVDTRPGCGLPLY